MPRFSYQRRPAKHIERLLIVEGCRRLVAAFGAYSYVGFGGIEFIDFDLFHRALGIGEMISIEKDYGSEARYEFNKPFAGVSMRIGRASDHLPVLDWQGLRIVWLDYECQLNEEVIRDSQTVARNAIPGSVLIVSVNAKADGTDKLARLTANVTEDRVPDDVTEDSLKPKWGFAAAQRRIVSEAVGTTVAHRGDAVHLQQVFNFNYADDARMQTIGWILAAPGIDRALDGCRLDELPFVRTGDDAMEIRVPVLTQKELRALNERLPKRPGRRRRAVSWLTEDDQKAYAVLYRWYPAGGE